MQQSESDSGGSWEPYEHADPWAPRQAGEPEQGTEPFPPDGGDQDTIAFGRPAGAFDGPPDHGGSGYGGSGYGGYGYGGYGGDDGNSGDYDVPGWALPGPPPRGPRRGSRLLIYLAVAGLAAGIGTAATVTLDHHNAAKATGIPPSQVPAPHDNAAGGRSATLNQQSVESKVEPGMVDITSTLRYSGEKAEGTGMILSASGLVLTNNHVIDGATTVRARLADAGLAGTTYRVRVVGYDSTADVALLQLEGATGLQTVTFGNSSQVKLGAAVLALGNAEGRGGVTPAPGTISGLDESIQASDEGSGTTENLHHMLQTNAQIQQGDSGGALADSAGQVIGMITAANTAGPGQFGQQGATTGFAIPANAALAIARQIDQGRASSTVYIGVPGFLGVQVAPSNSPDPQQQQAAGQQQPGTGGGSFPGAGGNGAACLEGGQSAAAPQDIAPASTGALIVGVLCGTAADASGLAPGDVITSVDGQAVTTPGSLTGITARYHPGDVVSVTWVDITGARHTASITLGRGPAR